VSCLCFFSFSSIDSEVTPSKLTSKQEELLLEESEEWVEQKLLITTQPPIEISEKSIELEESVHNDATVEEPACEVSVPAATAPTTKQRTSPRNKAKAPARKMLKRGGVAHQKQKSIAAEETEATMVVDAIHENAASSENVIVEQSTITTTTTVMPTTSVVVEDNVVMENNESVTIETLTSSPEVENELISSPVRVIECKLNEINVSKGDQTDEESEKMENKSEIIADQEVPIDTEPMQQEGAVTPNEEIKKRRIVHTDSTNDDVLDLDYSQTEGGRHLA
jgi:hypothetical protein